MSVYTDLLKRRTDLQSYIAQQKQSIERRKEDRRPYGHCEREVEYAESELKKVEQRIRGFQ